MLLSHRAGVKISTHTRFHTPRCLTYQVLNKWWLILHTRSLALQRHQSLKLFFWQYYLYGREHLLRGKQHTLRSNASGGSWRAGGCGSKISKHKVGFQEGWQDWEARQTWGWAQDSWCHVKERTGSNMLHRGAGTSGSERKDYHLTTHWAVTGTAATLITTE